jgi:hypothetical protein
MMLRFENILWSLSFAALVSCGDQDETSVTGEATTPAPQGMGAGTGGTSASAEPPPCVENPTTHLDLINACTTAVGVLKTPQLSLLNPDGSLPPP